MIIMRKVICLILALVFCMSLALPAFATRVSSAADSGTPSYYPIISATGNPKTGDMIMMWVIMMLVAVVALAAVVVCYRKFAR